MWNFSSNACNCQHPEGIEAMGQPKSGTAFRKVLGDDKQVLLFSEYCQAQYCDEPAAFGSRRAGSLTYV